MPLTQREYDEAELRTLERRLADVIDPARQTTPTAAARDYRESLRRDIARLRERLAVEAGE
jgi:hypothetical protein